MGEVDHIAEMRHLMRIRVELAISVMFIGAALVLEILSEKALMWWLLK